MIWTLLMAVVAVSAHSHLPDKWWLSTKGTHVETMSELNALERPVLVNFYCETCEYCYHAQETWNSLVGSSLVQFAKIDGTKH